MNSRNKVIFLGDSGVGKSTLINSLSGNHTARPQSTLGCSIQILPHQYQAGTPGESTELVELWDIGGSNAHREASRVFLEGACGAVFVHDLSNSRSEQNLASWLDLLQCQRRQMFNTSLSNSRLASGHAPVYSPVGMERHGGHGCGYRNSFVALDVERISAIPTLVVGTHLDQCPSRKPRGGGDHANSLLHQYEHIALEARQPIQPGSTNALVFSTFFDAVIRHSSECVNHHGSGAGGGSSSPSLNTGSPRHRRVGKMQ